MIRLTARGLGVATVGIALLVAAGLTGLQSLAWPGGLLLGLVGTALLLAVLSARRPRQRRRLLPHRVAAGAPVRVALDLERDSIGAGAWSVVEEEVPKQLTGAPAIAVPSGWGRLRSPHHYQLTAQVRGRYPVGPSVWLTTDPLGLAGTRQRLGGVDLLTVTPAIHSLGAAVRAAGAGLTGESAHRRSSLLGPDDALIREYRPRDEMRRIHWPSSARTGTLMVRREEHAWEPSALILLDNRSATHEGVGAGSTFEWAVSAAASVGVYLLDAGYEIDLVDADGDTLAAEGDTVREALLDHLTDIRLTGADDLARALISGPGAHGQLLVAVLGRLSRADAIALTGTRREGRLCHALVMQPHELGGEDPADVLEANGWRVVRGAGRLSIPDAWAGLDWGVRR